MSERVVLILAVSGEALRREHADHDERQIADADRLAERRLIAEDAIHDGLSEDANVCEAVHILLGERRTGSDGPAANVKKLRRDAAIAGVPIQAVVNDLHLAVHVAGDAFDDGDALLNRGGIVEKKRFRGAVAGAHAVDVAAAGFDPDEVVAQDYRAAAGFAGSRLPRWRRCR